MEDPSRLRPRAETSACGYSSGDQRGIFQSEAKHLGRCRWPRPRGGSWDGDGAGMEPGWGWSHCGVPGLQRAPRSREPVWAPRGTVTLPHPGVTAETGRGDTAELPARSLLPRGFSIPTCWQEGWRGHHAALGGPKSGSPPCQTGLGLWQRPSSLQRKKGFTGIRRDSNPPHSTEALKMP